MFKNFLQKRVELFKELIVTSEIERALQLQREVLRKGGKILIFGNGGSATQAMHYAAELVNKFKIWRKACAAIALNSDQAVLTSTANDSGYELVFARQVEALARPEDLLFGLTTSGKSPNVLRALEEGLRRGVHTVVLCGNNLTELSKIGPDLIISFPLEDTPLIQELHLICLHYFAEEIEKGMEE